MSKSNRLLLLHEKKVPKSYRLLLLRLLDENLVKSNHLLHLDKDRS
jgi:hypothetical protein